MNLSDIGNRIKFIRINKLGISQHKFAKMLNKDRAYINRLECGKQNITVETLFLICEKGLKVSESDFFNFDKIDFQD